MQLLGAERRKGGIFRIDGRHQRARSKEGISNGLEWTKASKTFEAWRSLLKVEGVEERVGSGGGKGMSWKMRKGGEGILLFLCLFQLLCLVFCHGGGIAAMSNIGSLGFVSHSQPVI